LSAQFVSTICQHNEMAMTTLASTPSRRALAKLEQIERELRKSPDFQLYLVAKSPKDRARMERMLKEIPTFRLWHLLAKSVGALDNFHSRWCDTRT
jgi:hypothetical protein